MSERPSAREPKQRLLDVLNQELHDADAEGVQRIIDEINLTVYTALKNSPSSLDDWQRNGGAAAREKLAAFFQAADVVGSTLTFLRQKRSRVLPEMEKLAGDVERARTAAQRLLWEGQAGQPLSQSLFDQWHSIRGPLLTQGETLVKEKGEARAQALRKTSQSFWKRLGLVGALAVGAVADKGNVEHEVPVAAINAKREITRRMEEEAQAGSTRREHRDRRRHGRPALNLQEEQAGIRHEFDLRSVGGEAGEFSEGQAFARVEFFRNNEIHDNLWATSNVARSGSLFYAMIPNQLASLSTVGSAEARVETRLTLSPGQSVVLPVPVGYAPLPTSVEVDGRRLGPTEFDAWHGTIRVRNGGDNVSVRYDVGPVTARPRDPIPPEPEAIVRSPEDRQRLANMMHEQPPSPEVLRQIVGDFTYVVSEDLQDILQDIPGTMEEKAGILRIGDCDVISAYAAGFLYDMGRRSGVASGYLENSGTIRTTPHGKVFYEGSDHRMYTFEATAQTRRQYVNLELRDADYERLSRIASSIHGTELRSQHLGTLQEFRTALDQILSDPHYSRFQNHSEHALDREADHKASEAFRIAPENQGKRSLQQRWEQMSYNQKTNVGGTVGALMIVFFGIGGMVGYEKTKRRFKGKAWQDRAKVLEQFVSADPPEKKTVGEKKDLLVVDRNYRTQDALRECLLQVEEALDVRLTEDDLKKMPLEKQQLLATLALFLSVLDGGEEGSKRLFELGHWLEQNNAAVEWQRSMESLESGGMSQEKFYDMLRKQVRNPERTAAWENHRTDEARQLIQSGGKMVTTILKQEGERGRVETDRALQAFGVSPALLEEQNAAQRARPGRGSEMAGLRPYQPGDDPRLINQKILARTRRVMVQEIPDATRETIPVRTFNLVIDLANVGQREMEQLAALMLYTQKRPQSVKIMSITATAYGKTCFHWGEQDVARVIQVPAREGRASLLQGFFEMLERISIEQHVFPPVKDYNENNNRYWQAHSHPVFDQAFKGAEPKNLPQEGYTVFFGVHAGSQEGKYGGVESAFDFERPKEKITAPEPEVSWVQKFLARFSRVEPQATGG